VCRRLTLGGRRAGKVGSWVIAQDGWPCFLVWRREFGRMHGTVHPRLGQSTGWMLRREEDGERTGRVLVAARIAARAGWEIFFCKHACTLLLHYYYYYYYYYCTRVVQTMIACSTLSRVHSLAPTFSLLPPAISLTHESGRLPRVSLALICPCDPRIRSGTRRR
jgi:hypothetical protein